MEDHVLSRNFHGITISGNVKSVCNASFDDVPDVCKEASAKRRSIPSVVDHDEEDQE